MYSHQLTPIQGWSTHEAGWWPAGGTEDPYATHASLPPCSPLYGQLLALLGYNGPRSSFHCASPVENRASANIALQLQHFQCCHHNSQSFQAIWVSEESGA